MWKVLYKVGHAYVSAFSRAYNYLFLGAEGMDLTTSARSHLRESDRWEKRRKRINWIFSPWQEDHCEGAWIAEVESSLRTLEKAEVLKRMEK